MRGEKGVEILLRDARGRIQGRYMDGKYDKTPVPGKNLKLGIDIELQMLGERLLEEDRQYSGYRAIHRRNTLYGICSHF